MIVTALNPELQANAVANVNESLSPRGVYSVVSSAYSTGNLPAAMALTFAINLAVGAVLTMTVPSLVVPFVGLAMGLYRAATWGLLFSPVSPAAQAAFIPHSLTLLLEGQAYVLAMFAVYLHGKSFVYPRRSGARSHWEGYKRGLVQAAWVHVPIVVLLVVGAVYEAVEVIYFIPLFS